MADKGFGFCMVALGFVAAAGSDFGFEVNVFAFKAAFAAPPTLLFCVAAAAAVVVAAADVAAAVLAVP